MVQISSYCLTGNFILGAVLMLPSLASAAAPPPSIPATDFELVKIEDYPQTFTALDFLNEAKSRNNWCPVDDITITQENLDAVSVQTFYESWRQGALEREGGIFDRHGEVGQFVRDWLNEPDFDCDIVTGCPKFSCREVATQVQFQNRVKEMGLNEEEMELLSRQIYLTLKQIDNFNRYLASYHSVLSSVQTNLLSLTKSIIHDFTTQGDERSELGCKIVNMLYQKMVQYIHFTWDISTKAQFTDMGTGGQIFLDELYQAATMFVEHKIQKGTNDKAVLQMPDTVVTARKRLLTSQSYTQGMCQWFGGGMPDENERRIDQMNRNIKSLFMDTRASLSGLWYEAQVGSSRNLIGNIIGSTRISEALKQMGHLAEAEHGLTKAFTENFISAALSSSKCYSKCQTKLAKTDQKYCSGSGYFNKDSRICPADTEVCQAQCWTSQQMGNHEKLLNGLQALPKYGLSAFDVLWQSRAEYLDHGNQYISAGAASEWNPYYLAQTAAGNRSMMVLPTCRSDMNPVTNFDNRIIPGLKHKQNQAFPVSCGSWKSEETAEFYEAIGLGKDSNDRKSGAAKETLEKIWPRKVKEIKAPLTRFLAFCGADLQFPQKGTGTKAMGEPLHDMHRIKMKRGSAPQCAPMREEIEGMTELEANIHFCTASETGKEIFKKERSYAENYAPFLSNHKALCKKLMKNPKAIISE